MKFPMEKKGFARGLVPLFGVPFRGKKSIDLVLRPR